MKVALVEKHDIGSQTSPRAAGMVSYARKGELMTRLVQLAGKKLARFTEETGQPLALTRSGSLKVARRPTDATVIEDDLARGKRLGLDVERISPEAAHRLNPFLRPDGIEAVMRVGDDMYFDPAQVAVGFARAAAARGATLLPRTTVTRIAIEQGRVTGVDTDRGPIRAPVVVDAAGAWTRQVAEMGGLRIPLVPTGQQLFVTEPVDGARAAAKPAAVSASATPRFGCPEWGVKPSPTIPPGFSTRRISRNPATASGQTCIELIASALSKLSSPNGRCSTEPRCRSARPL
jgi:4-methylaminobutanoate oxidase (formaldehyde-forming)